jgi:hypothetical protein
MEHASENEIQDSKNCSLLLSSILELFLHEQRLLINSHPPPSNCPTAQGTVIHFTLPDFRIISDMDFWWRAGLVGDFIHLPIVVSAFRQHGGSQTSVGGKRMALETVKMTQKYFSNPALPKNIKKLKRQALSTAYASAARQSLGTNDIKLSFIFKSLINNPISFIKPETRYRLRFLIDLYLR